MSGGRITNFNTIRKNFPAIQKITYLDNASTTQKPKEVIELQEEYYLRSNANVHRGVYKLAQQATDKYEEARALEARFFSSRTDEVAFTSGTTASINMLAQSLLPTLQKGDEILLSELEHHSNLVPWQNVAIRTGAKLVFIPHGKNGGLTNAEKYITKKTRVVSLTQCSNTFGSIIDVHKIGKLAQGQGAVMIVDGAQSAPHLPINFSKLACDYFVCSSHKMYGPTGVGVLLGKKASLEHLSPSSFGGGMIRSVSYTDAAWNDIPWRFEAGTPNIAGVIGFGKAVSYLQKIGIDAILTYEQKLMKHGFDALSDVRGLKLYGFDEPTNHASIFSFSLGNIHPHDVATLLDRDNICVRAGHHCTMPLMKKLGIPGTVRVSLSFYNTKEEIDKLTASLEKVKKVFA